MKRPLIQVIILACLILFPFQLQAQNIYKLRTLQGNYLNILDKQEPYKLVTFWASWCIYCKIEFPLIRSLTDYGVATYGITYKDDSFESERFLKLHNNPYKYVLFDSENKQSQALKITQAPTSFFLENNVVIARYDGELTLHIVNKIKDYIKYKTTPKY